jgi:hypothetical protein
MTHSEFVGIQVLVKKHASQIELFETWAFNSLQETQHDSKIEKRKP